MKKEIIHRDHDLVQGRERDALEGALDAIERLSRRRFLTGGAAVLTAGLLGRLANLVDGSPVAYADEHGTVNKAVKTGKFIFPRLQFSVSDETKDIWNVGPIGDAILRKKLAELTNINVSQEPKVVRLSEFDDLCRQPFVFMTSEGHFRLKKQEEKNMREFLERGGFIHADDCVWKGKEDRFFRCYNELMNKLFPDNPMRKIPLDHEIFRIYYKFPKGSPHMQGVPHGAYGMFEPGTGRIMTINTPGDLHCGWMCRYWKPEKNLESIKMGINIILYFLSH